MKTGQIVDELGLYSSECCSVELIFDIGDTYSRCPECEQLCAWDLENEIVPADELEGDSDNELAA